VGVVGWGRTQATKKCRLRHAAASRRIRQLLRRHFRASVRARAPSAYRLMVCPRARYVFACSSALLMPLLATLRYFSHDAARLLLAMPPLSSLIFATNAAAHADALLRCHYYAATP